MNQKILIYGAYGYTGELISRLAVSWGWKPTLAGRQQEPLEALANALNLPWLAFPLSDTAALEQALSEADVLLHCAGPYSQTAKPAVEACLRTKTHYFDITGEMEVFEWVAAQHERAQKAGIVLMPGTGFDVVPTDCLALYLKGLMPDATHLELAFKGVGKMSRGTALTMAESSPKGGAIRENGKIKPVPSAYKTRKIALQGQSQEAVTIPWGDVSTAWHSTGIPNIMVYTVMPPQLIQKMKKMRYFGWLLQLSFVQERMKKKIRSKVKGPTEEQRKKSKSYIWGEVRNAAGDIKEARLITPEGYTLTAEAALRCVEQTLVKNLAPGFYTPAKAFGADFVLSLSGVERS